MVYAAILAVAAYARHVYDVERVGMTFRKESFLDLSHDVVGETEADKSIYGHGGSVFDNVCGFSGIYEFHSHVEPFQFVLSVFEYYIFFTGEKTAHADLLILGVEQ